MSRRRQPALIQPGALVERPDAEILDLAAEPINAFEKALGGRSELISSLSIDATPEIRDLVEMLLDTRYDARSLGWLAAKVDIGLTDLLRAYRNGMLAKAQIMAAQAIAAKLPDIVRDVMLRAAPFDEACHGCRGTGTLTVRPTKKVPTPDPAEIDCTICRGQKTIRKVPDLDRQRLALELGELIKTPRGGPTLLQQFNLNPGSAAGNADPGSLERMQQAVSDILYGRNSVIEITPIPPESSKESP